MTRMIAALVAACLMAFSAQAQSPQEAEDFVRVNADKVLTTLGDDTLSLEAKKEVFRDLVDDVVDVPRVTRFVLGKYKAAERNPAYGDQDQLDADIALFAPVFREYATGVYETQLGEYGGQTLTVNGSTARRPTDVIVHTTVTGVGDDDDLDVNWRVIFGDDGPLVVDVEVIGVWLALNQRDEIVGILGQNNGRIPAAIDALQRKITDRRDS